MNHYPKSIRNLIEQIAKLPGIGQKTAERLAVHLLKTPRSEVELLARSMIEMKARVRLCRHCFALADGEICGTCSDPGRDDDVLCVVEQPADMVAIEKSGAFRGRYHILQGVLSPIEGVGPDQIRLRELLQRVSQGNFTEVIIATGTSVEGEATGSFLAERLKPMGVRITRIASGVPMGGDLKYIDQVTLKKALDARHGV
jgi:recombination protein RecR